MWRNVFNIDAAVQKTFPLKEAVQLNLRGEFFNLFNHANFSLPGTSVSSTSTFGVINGANDPRILQIGLRLSARGHKYGYVCAERGGLGCKERRRRRCP